MNYLDQAGIFKVRPLDWRVRSYESSQAVAIEIDFIVVAHYDNGDWVSWEQAGDWRVRGRYFVTKKDGTPNMDTCQQLAVSMGWGGSLKATREPPPECIVQVTVKAETRDGKTFHNAQWMNPENFVPLAAGADDATVDQLEARFGSLLRAAASGSKKPGAKPAAKPKPKPEAPKTPAPAEPPSKPDYDEIPF